MKGALFSVYGVFVYYGALAFFAVGGIVYSVVSTLLYLFLPKEIGGRVGRRILGWLFRLFVGLLKLSGIVKVDCKEVDRLRRPGGVLIAPNHPCLIDAVLIVSRIPDAVCVMKSSILRNPVLGGGAYLAGFIPNEPPTAMVKSAVKALEAGRKLVIFPEGTRTVTAPVNAFQRSFAVIAKAAGVPVQVVYVETNSPCLGKGWPILKVPRFPLRYRVRLGEEYRVPQEGEVRDWVSEIELEFRKELEGKVVVLPRSED